MRFFDLISDFVKLFKLPAEPQEGNVSPEEGEHPVEDTSVSPEEGEHIRVITPPIASNNEFEYLQIPERQDTFLTGTQFFNSIINNNSPSREDAFLQEFLKGNIPTFMRKLYKVESVVGSNKLEFFVIPDFLSIGSDTDFVRTPLLPGTARKVCDAFGCVLPTRKMSNLIWKSSTFKMEPLPIPPDSLMGTTKRFLEHNQKVEAKYPNRNLDMLVAGQKKDIVYTPALNTYPNNVAIYGWFYLTGSPIQPLNASSHNNMYSDYSHGVRLVYKYCLVNGQKMLVNDIWKDKNLTSLINDENKTFDSSKFYL